MGENTSDSATMVKYIHFHKSSVLCKKLIFTFLLMIVHKSVEDNFTEVKTILKKNFELLQLKFFEYHMVLNPGKYHYSIISKDITSESIELGNKTLHAEAEQKLLDIIIATDLNLRRHSNSVLKTIKS